MGPNTGASSVKDKSRAGFVPLCLQKGIKSLLSVQVFDAFLQILLCASTVKHCSKETDCIKIVSEEWKQCHFIYCVVVEMDALYLGGNQLTIWFQ